MNPAKAGTFFRRSAVIAADVAAVGAAYYFAFLLRYDFAPGAGGLELFRSTWLIPCAAYLFASLVCRLYRGLHPFGSLDEIGNIVKTASLGGLLFAAAAAYLFDGEVPRVVLLLQPLLLLCGLSAIRIAIFKTKAALSRRAAAKGEPRRVILVGAGEMGEIIMNQLLRQQAPGYKVVAIIDDDPSKRGMRMQGAAVAGGRGALAGLLKAREVDEIIIAIASGRSAAVRGVLEAVRQVSQRPEIKIAPSLDEMLRSPRDGVSMRKVRPADLLNREVVRLDAARIGETFRGKTILVSGAGGTIGAELCRQVVQYGPACVIMLENHATALFYSEKEVLARGGRARIVPILGDVRDTELLDRVYREHRPHVVLHAAAHKHVHQLEFNVQEGVSNNTLGTYHMASAAERHGAEVFLLVSTDKAVRPSCVMGATKRAAEVVVKAMAKSSRTRFVAVRFGNVLGSSGSVLKIFQEQIARGESITVTDAAATRYFMTVEESVGLILQAASISKGGDIFVLKMGEPVRIMDMAKNLIVLSGYELGRDIEIKVTGLRQGEKLHEELIEDSAGVDDSEHPEILRLRGENGEISELEARMRALEDRCRGADPHAVLRELLDLVPTFQPAAEHVMSGSRGAARLHISRTND